MFETYTRQMLQRLYDEVLDAMRTGRRGDLLKRDFQHLADDAFEELRLQLWQYMRTMLPGEREAANTVAAPLLEGFTRIRTGLEGSIIKALLTDQEFDEKRKVLQYRFDVAQHHAWTLTATGTGAANEAKRIQEAISAGYTHFKYVGPAPEREFCMLHFDKTYSVEEILALDNGHNLNPLYFRGGYNCRHTWVPVKAPVAQQSAPAASVSVSTAPPVVPIAVAPSTAVALPTVARRGTPLVELARSDSEKNVLKRFFGDDMTQEELSDAFDFGPELQKSRTRVYIEPFGYEGRESIEVTWNIADINGGYAGVLKRIFKYDFTDREKKVVDHAYFSLERRFQGQGVAKRMLKGSVEFYDKIGIKAIEVHANLDMGKYTWAKFGFQFKRAEDRVTLMDSFKSYFIRSSSIDDVTRNSIIEKIGELQTPQDFAAFKVELNSGTVTGKDIILGDRSLHWYGTLDLDKSSLDRQLFDRYLEGSQ